MQIGALAVVGAMGCSASIDSAPLVISPSEIAMTVDLQATAPVVPGIPAGTGQLWLAAFYPDRGILSPAFHLPGQGAISMLHGPLALP